MADIRIERKENNLWPWLIGLLALLLLGAAAFYLLDREDVVDLDGSERTEQTAPVPDTL